MACIKINISDELLDEIEEYLSAKGKPDFSTVIEGFIGRIKDKALNLQNDELFDEQDEKPRHIKKGSPKKTMQKVIDDAYVLCQKAIKGNFKYASKLYPRACQMIADVSVTLLDGQLRHRSSHKEMEVKSMLNRLYERLEPEIRWDKLKGVPLTEEERVYDNGDQ